MSHEELLRRERALLRYYIAASSGDMDGVCRVLSEAEHDPVLQRQILEMEDALTDEEAKEAVEARDRAIVIELLDRYLSSRPEEPPGSLTVGVVVSRMQGDRSVSATDRAAAQMLQSSGEPLPSNLSVRAARELLSRLGAVVSDRFQRAFRDTALLLGLSTSQEQAAFARRQAPSAAPRPPNKGGSGEQGGSS